MNNLNTAQKIYLGLMCLIGGAWLLLLIGVPVVEYENGRTPLTGFLSNLTGLLLLALGVLAAAAFVLQMAGVFPSVTREPASGGSTGYSFSPIRHFRNLAVWIVIALLLVFFFNLFQGSNSGSHAPAPAVAPSSRNFSIRNQDGTIDMVAILVNWFPMFLLVGVWMYFMRKMQKNKNRQPPDGNSD